MAKIKPINRLTGGYKYVTAKCRYCRVESEIQIDKPVKLDLPYCSNCNKIVFDCTQNFCCWCGEEFEE